MVQFPLLQTDVSLQLVQERKAKPQAKCQLAKVVLTRIFVHLEQQQHLIQVWFKYNFCCVISELFINSKQLTVHYT